MLMCAGASRQGGPRRVLTEQGVGDIQQDASDITLDLRIEAHLGLRLKLLGLLAPLHSSANGAFRFPSLHASVEW